jgi:peptidoglycan/LPS O-acetylase OafA/YrhL
VERRILPLWAIVTVSAVGVFSLGWTETWTGVVVTVGLLCAMGFGAAFFPRSTAWGRRQVAAIAVGALLAQAVTGFLAVPIGDVEPFAKFAHNTAATLLVIALGCWALRRTR